MRKTIWVATLFAGLAGCAAEPAVLDLDSHAEENLDDEIEYGVSMEGLRLSGLSRGCSTAGTEGLSRQLLDEMLCLAGGQVVEVSHANVIRTSSRVHLILSPQGRDALLSVAATRRVEINSAFRTLAEQYVLYRGCSVAARPGRSNHETGRAIDVANYGSVGPALQRAGFTRPLPSSDPVHYEAAGRDLRSLSVIAFQKLWNRNNPRDRLSEDGVAGTMTLDRLSRSPAEGFPIGAASCAEPEPAPEPEPTPTPTPTPTGRSCTHSFGGAYADRACSASYQCCDGAWRTRSGGCGTCTCVEGTGETGCGI